MPNHIVNAFSNVSNQNIFAAHLQGLINHIEPKEGIYAASNIFTYQRNLGFFKDEKFIKAATTHINGATEEAAIWRFAVVAWAAKHGLRMPGDFIECAANRGTAARIVCDYLDFGQVDKRYIHYDLFQGNPTLALSESIPNAIVCRGHVTEALGSAAPGPIAFMHLDLPNAEDEMAALNHLFDHMVPRAILVLSNFGCQSHAKHQTLQTPWFAARGYSVLELPTGQGLVLK